MNSRGVLYVATGEQYLNEAAISAQSVKACMPQMHITVFTDQPGINIACFDEIGIIEDPQYSYIDKIQPLKKSPYERTLFLDSDTYIADPCEELFELLDRFDLAAAHDTWRLGYNVPNCPDSFVEFNTGVILYQQNQKFKEFIDRWHLDYKNQLKKDPTVSNDQSAFRKALYNSSLSLYVLPSEYNYTVWFPGFIGACGKVKILHGRNDRFVQTANWINASREARVFIPSTAFLNRSSFNILSPRGQLLTSALSQVISAKKKIRNFSRFRKSE